MLLLDSSTTEFSAVELNNAVAEWERLQFADPLFVAPDDVPKSDWWQITHAASDASNGATKRVIARAAEILGAAPKGRITEAIENGDVAGALALFGWEAYQDFIQTGLSEVFGTIGVRSGADTAIEIGKGIDYDETGFLKEAARGARIVAARITKSTRRATSDSLRRLMGSGTLSPEQVRLQVFGLLGLDPVQANAAVNKIIAQRESGLSLKKVREATKELANKAREQREERIARFENLNAAQTAQEDAVKQHVDVRAINNVVKVWVIVPDDSTCPICNRLRGQRQIEGDSFEDPGTGLTYIGPPAHQACRCGLRYLEARKDPRATGVFVVDIRLPDDDGPVTLAREDLQARIFGGKHDQKTHGRRKSGAREVADYNKFAANHQSDGYNASGVTEQKALGGAMASEPFSRETSEAMDEHFGEATRRQTVVNAVERYGSEQYTAINVHLRGGGNGTDETQKTVKGIDQAFAEVTPLRSSIIVHRGVKSDRFKGVKAGDEFQDLGYTSTSTSAAAANIFTKNIGGVSMGPGDASGSIFRITVPKGIRALPFGAVTGKRDEKEVILPRGSKFKITKVTTVGSQTRIEAELLR